MNPFGIELDGAEVAVMYNEFLKVWNFTIAFHVAFVLLCLH